MASLKHVFKSGIIYLALFLEYFQYSILKNLFQILQYKTGGSFETAIIKKTAVIGDGLQMGIEI